MANTSNSEYAQIKLAWFSLVDQRIDRAFNHLAAAAAVADSSTK